MHHLSKWFLNVSLDRCQYHHYILWSVIWSRVIATISVVIAMISVVIEYFHKEMLIYIDFFNCHSWAGNMIKSNWDYSIINLQETLFLSSNNGDEDLLGLFYIWNPQTTCQSWDAVSTDRLIVAISRKLLLHSLEKLFNRRPSRAQAAWWSSRLWLFPWPSCFSLSIVVLLSLFYMILTLIFSFCS